MSDNTQGNAPVVGGLALSDERISELASPHCQVPHAADYFNYAAFARAVLADAASLIAERDARIAELRARFDATQSMFMSAIRDLAAINVRIGCDPDDGGAVPIIEAIDELKRMVADQASKGQRLALELECLLLDIKDNAIVSKWWDSALDAIEDWRKV